MSSSDRQNRLLLAEDWKKIYQSFRNADFQSYDFENLRRVMIDYIRQNYPEDFNDYIESSEFLALIDVIAFLGQSIAFRVDLNARENFLELAERRSSILRLARLISYNAKRNKPATGLLKFNTIQTTQSVIDSNGRNLAGQVITWNDASNANWRDQFMTVLNTSFSSNQQFGNPSDKATVQSIPTEQYRMEATTTDVPIYSFNKTVAGMTMAFEITSTTFAGENYIYEEAPAIGNKIACVYKDDGRGTASTGTGFYFNFVQGLLNTGTFTIAQPSNSESIDIDSEGINDNDVWLYRLDANGLETELWEKVSNFEGNNVIYNSISKDIRNIYGVTTRTNDSVSLSFSDGTFGNLPRGTFRTYYRMSNGISYVINPQDIRSVAIAIPYTSNRGQTETLSISLSLPVPVSNSASAESNASIKSNAPATYYTQNRMITGEDYNISPLSVNQQVLKVKSVNRSSSGISRYFDLVDPTGKYSSTNLFADDGVVYVDAYEASTRFSYTSRTDIERIIYNKVFDIIARTGIRNYFYSKYVDYVTTSLHVSWNSATSDINSSTGYIKNILDNVIYPVGAAYTATDLKYIRVGALVKFTAPAGTYFDSLNSNKLVNGLAVTKGAKTDIWATIISVTDDGRAKGSGVLSSGDGAIVLNAVIPSLSIITQIMPAFRTVVDPSVITTMIDLIFSNKPFGLRYDATDHQWKIIFEANLDATAKFTLGKQGITTNTQQDSSWMLLFTTDNEFYTITSRESKFVFESDKQIRFYFDRSTKVYDGRTNTIVTDIINILNINTTPPLYVHPFTTDLKWDIVSDFQGLDGYIDNKKIVVTFADTDFDGVVDDPELFLKIVSPPVSSTTYSLAELRAKYVISQKYVIAVGQEDYKYVSNANDVVLILSSKSTVGSLLQYKDGQYFYFIDTDVVTRLSLPSGTFTPTLDYKVYVGRDKLKFQYIHSADYESRIDPGVSNIIDVFVLTKSYDTLYRQWIDGATMAEPLSPSSSELYNILGPDLNLIKPISDEIIYHPVNYRVLFGATATPDLQAIFKITKNVGQVMSDNDIKAKVIAAINQFFALENWDFGDTFYFTELSTYVMNQLTPAISTFVIVPRQGDLNFGSLFEIKAQSNQLFINGATVADIEIITGITSSNIKSVSGTAPRISTIIQQSTTSSTYGNNL